MARSINRYVGHMMQSAKTAFLGPQMLAFLPALMLAGFWFGGEAVLLFVAVVLPALLGLVGVFTPVKTPIDDKGPVDPITQLPMRSALENSLDRAFALEADTGLRSAALMLEIDDFNDFQNQAASLIAPGFESV